MRGQLSLSRTEDYAMSFARNGITPDRKTSGIILRVKPSFLEGKTTLNRVDGKVRPLQDQLNEILTKETIPPESLEILKNGKWQPLIEKSNPLNYKTVEEYVKAQGTSVFRGQSHEGFTAFDGKEKGRFIPGMSGTSFSTTKELAQNYGDKIIEGFVDKKSLLKPSDINQETLLGIKAKIKKLTPDDYIEGYDFEDIVSEISDLASKQNKTAIKLTDFFPKSKIDDEIRVLSKDAFKTKSQLISEWNKAQKLK